MKKTFILVCLSAMALSLAGCVKQTELSGETLPQKITVSGYVRYVEAGEEPELVNPGTPETYITAFLMKRETFSSP